MTHEPAPSGRLVRFLNETSPAKLLICSAAAIMLTALCGIVASKLNTGWNWGASVQDWNSWNTPDSYRVVDLSGDPQRAPLWKRTLPTLLNIGVLSFGIVSALLPMWAVGRLISDTIKEGHTNE